MKQLLRSFAPALLATILIGCASSSFPPLQPATSLKSIAGTWKGFTTDAAGRPLYPATLVIKEDGTYQWFNPTVREAPFSGTIVIENGKFQWSDSAMGGKGELALHEGDGQRVLTRSGQGIVETEKYTPAP